MSRMGERSIASRAQSDQSSANRGDTHRERAETAVTLGTGAIRPYAESIPNGR